MPIKFMLWTASLIYGIIVKILSTGYENFFFIPYKADPKVISIGNITVGGTGKTQAVMTIARILERLGKRVSVLIRGYGIDEYRMLEEELRDVPILVGPDRIKNSKRAFYDFGVDTVILDDGFQHYKIYRDLDIVLLDATLPFGNHELIPRGILREPITALKRAGLIIITKVDSQTARLDEVYKVIDTVGKSNCVLESVYSPLDLYEITSGRAAGLRAIEGRSVAIVSGVASPAYLRQNIANLGVGSIESEFVFMDHYNYKIKDFLKIEEECRLFGVDFIIVTKKDAVKIRRFSLSSELTIPILVLDVEFTITKNKEILYDRLSRIYSN